MSRVTEATPHLYPVPYPAPAGWPMPELASDPVTSISLTAIWGIVRRHLWWIALVTFAAIVATAIVLHYIPARFRAEAVLQVTQPLPPVPTDSLSPQENTIDELAVNSELDAVLSVPVLEQVIEKLNL